MHPVAGSFVEYGRQESKLDERQPAIVDIFNFNDVIRYMYTAEMTKLEYNATYCKHSRKL